MARSRRPAGNEDVDFTRCTNCGFPCKLSREKIGPGNGKVYSTLTRSKVLYDSAGEILYDSEGDVLTAQDDGVVYNYIPDTSTVTFGCPQCGRGDYTDSNFFR